MATNGIVVNELGHVLLIRRNDSRTFAPPGGGLELGELPTDGAAREVREETGLIVLPVRLVGLYFWRAKPQGYLSFAFRCLRRGGELTPSAESPQLGFFPTNPLPRPMMALHQERVQHGVFHKGGPVYWEVQKRSSAMAVGHFLLRTIIYPYMDWQRRRQRLPLYQPPPIWQTEATAVIRNDKGEVLWHKQGEQWQLPGGAGAENVPPWQTAVHHAQTQLQQPVTLINLSGVYPAQDKPHMGFTFTAKASSPAANGRLAYFPVGVEPPECNRHHIAQAADACSAEEETVFRFQP
jgi:ADP-ribose pyrophosphatase YjhB (NUDIX family)